jgi:hypothetical protein
MRNQGVLQLRTKALITLEFILMKPTCAKRLAARQSFGERRRDLGRGRGTAAGTCACVKVGFGLESGLELGLELGIGRGRGSRLEVK